MTELEIKAAVRARDGYRCTICGMTQDQHFLTYGRQLDVHRLSPGVSYTIHGTITVCRRCHASLPKRKPEEIPPDERRGHLLPTRVSDELWDVLQAIAKAERRTVAQVVIMLLEEALSLRGRLTDS